MLEIPRDVAVTAFDAETPTVARVGLGERFRVAAHDCYGGQITDADVLRPDIDMQWFNRATGPIEVSGVGAGDRAAVRVHEVSVDDAGVMALAPGLGVLGDRIDWASTRILEIRDGRAWLNDDIGVPIRPMIGVIGVATARASVPTSTPGAHGGNLDTRLIGAGAVVSFRSRRDGLGLAVGDLHAVQGDGELGGTGVEIAGTATLSVDLVDERGDGPVVIDGTGVHVLGSAATLEAAIRIAFDDAVQLMAAWHGLEWGDAYRLTSLVGHARVSQVVNPLRTARIELPLEWCRGTYAALSAELSASGRA